jgi:hypothetical protein
MSNTTDKAREYGQVKDVKGAATSRPNTYISDISRKRETASHNLKKTGRLRMRIQKRSRRSKMYMAISCAVIAVTVISAFSVFFPLVK